MEPYGEWSFAARCLPHVIRRKRGARLLCGSVSRNRGCAASNSNVEMKARLQRSSQRRATLLDSLCNGPETDRVGISQVQKAAPQRRGTNRRQTLKTPRQHPRTVHRIRVPKLLQTLRLPPHLKQNRSSSSAAFRRRASKAKPNSPMPARARVEGSGTKSTSALMLTKCPSLASVRLPTPG